MVADFSALAESGLFYLNVTGVGQSPVFRVTGDAVFNSFLLQMKGFYGWRCGTPVNLTYRGTTWAHPACHLNDGYLDYLGGGHIVQDGTGGWHDAGDYGKYSVNGAFAAGVMLTAWEHFSAALSTVKLPIPGSGGPVPDYLAEIRYELLWMLKMQQADGSVTHKLTARNFEGYIMPEADGAERFFITSRGTTVGTTIATASFAAVMAKAARVYAPYDAAFANACRAAAVSAYNNVKVRADSPYVQPLDVSTGPYDGPDASIRLWMDAEIWETTGDAAALTAFEADGIAVYPDWDWGNPVPLGQFTYLFSARPGRDPAKVTQLRDVILPNQAGTYANRSRYGRAPVGYGWGQNGMVARAVMTLVVANRLAPNPVYLDAAFDQIGWLYGRNYYGRSQVTGEGVNPPLNPHHRPSIADGIADPWPGLLVGGGQTFSNWNDSQNDYLTNEVAVNWNASLTYALAAFLPARNPASAEIDFVSPPRGAANTESIVTIKGRNFLPGAAVTFQGIAAPSIVVVDNSTIWARVPARPAGAVFVAVTNPAADAAVLPNGFTYDAAAAAQRLFTDDPLVPRSTTAKAIHLTELRDAVNSVRVRAGLPQVQFTDAAPAGVAIKAAHITELRNALTPALAILGSAATYTDADPAGIIVKAVHVQEMRNYAR